MIAVLQTINLLTDKGKMYPFKGNYSGWLDYKEQRLALEAKKEASVQKALKREIEWIRQTPKARREKNKVEIEIHYH